MKIKFIPFDYSVFDFNGKNFVRIVGRDEKWKRVCLFDSYLSSFWAILEEGLSDVAIKKVMEKIGKIKVEKSSRKSCVEKVELCSKKFLGKKVKAIRIFVTNYKDMHSVASEIGFEEVVKRREYDVPLLTKYIIEKDLKPLVWCDVDGDLLNNSPDFGGADSVYDFGCFKINKISETEQVDFKPRILAYDIEVGDLEIGKSKILMVSLYGDDFKKVLTCEDCDKKQNYVECFIDEADMIEAFVKCVKEYSPDILTGYFSDGFDLPYLRTRAGVNKIKFDLGLDGSHPVFARGRIPSGKINGIVHVDLFRFIRNVYSQYLQSETLGLNDVAFELLGEKKEDFDFSKLNKMSEDDWLKFFSYNLRDSEITYKLAGKIWGDLLEFSKIMQEPLFDISRDSMSSHVENYILHNLNKFNEIAEKRPVHNEIACRRGLGKYEGAFVLQPIPGLYENLCMFDFASMYASVIVSYNLSLSTFIKEDIFVKEKGFFPEMLENIITKRRKYKKEYNNDKSSLKKARSNAYKLLANASYGYQGFFGARYYCREAAAATASFAKKNILEVIEKIKGEGYKVIYGDTDSIAFLMDKKTKKQVLDFLKKLNKELPGIMELDLEDFYRRGLFVSKKIASDGAKKKYALIDYDEKLKIRGFETVRRDWCKLARELQSDVLFDILKSGNEKKSLEAVKKIIKKVKGKKVDLKDLVIKTQLKKSIKEYCSKGPHVVAAEMMEKKGVHVSQGMLIEYYISNKKGRLIRDKVALIGDGVSYDVDYYLESQILSVVKNIFDVFDVDIKEIIDGDRQEKLF